MTLANYHPMQLTLAHIEQRGDLSLAITLNRIIQYGVLRPGLGTGAGSSLHHFDKMSGHLPAVNLHPLTMGVQ